MADLVKLNQQKVLDISNLTTEIKTPDGILKVIENVDFSVNKGEFLAIVGESGSGKSMTINSILQLIPKQLLSNYSGKVEFEGENLLDLPEKVIQIIRGKRISLIAQNAMTSLDPSFKIGQQIIEIITNKTSLTKKEAKERAFSLLENMGIDAPERIFNAYPHQLSGGLRQRAVIAMSLSCEPDIVIADEPTSALDPTVQLQVLNLLLEINRKHGTTVIMITHDFGVVSYVADKVVVMYAGQVIEKGNTSDIIHNPQHPYTISLIKCIPNLDWIFNGNIEKQRLWQIVGEPPILKELGSGCRFSNRCYLAKESCKKIEQQLVSIDKNDHYVRCMFARGGHRK